MTAIVTPGATFAGYRVESLVGRGGMGVVYRATDTSLERTVALKLIAPELAEEPRLRARFLKEQRLAASLEHPSVVPVYEAGERDGQLFLAMRFIEGSDLKTAIHRDGGLAPERALAILAQIADALDAAHRRGLVHRDVKPGNILIDEDGHAYLTDFGITKRVGAASTDTGHVLGTLDYLAPEQIRGEPIDGRTDGYALACVLHECIAGVPPFHRDTEAETMWAHLQESPPPLHGHPALDPVLRQALAKEKEERYAACFELIDAACAALGLAAPSSVRRVRARRRLLRRGRVMLAAGLLLLGAVAVAAITALTGGSAEAESVPTGNGVAAIDRAGKEIASFVETASAPSNIAVGEGAVWFLNSDNSTVSRIDPATKSVTRRFEAKGVPTDIAAGAGALWIGNGGGRDSNITVSVSRVDPGTGKVTHTAKLPDRTGVGALGLFSWGHPRIAVGAGAVWVINPDRTVSRLDPETGQRVATIDVQADGIAASAEGVWVTGGRDVVRIHPRTDRITERVRLSGGDASEIAVGGGKLWLPDEREGVVWQIEPGPEPIRRSIAVGAGVDYVAFGAGAAWVGNYIDGTVKRIDATTNRVTSVPVGAVQALAASASGTWVSTVGRPRAGAMPAAACREPASGGRKPDVLIASDLPLHGPSGAGPRAIADAIRLVLERRDFMAGRFSVGFHSCDNSSAQTGNFEARRCAANATAYALAKRLVAVVGPYNSYCAQIEIPILNQAPGGPLAMISPANTHPGLTRPYPKLESSDGYRGEPEVYYPTGIRNYVRVVPGEDYEGAAYALLAKRLGLGPAYLLAERSTWWKSELSDPFARAAGKLGVPIAGSEEFDPRMKRFDRLVDAIARSGAGAVVLGADVFNGGDRLVKALRARFGARFPIMACYFFPPRDTLTRLGRAAHGMYVSTMDLPRAAFKLNAAGRRFVRQVGASATEFPGPGVLEAGQATQLLMDAIARSDGTRASVLEELRATEVKDGILGSFRFDASGDITTASVPILRITGATPPGSDLPKPFRGAVLERVIDVPASLLR
jgi:ABC-type branched-subunit amino acid transport system substrate-binding protein/DNA-binding beta-propeller fold protein YncE